MTSRIATIAIDALDMDLVAGFWTTALGWRVTDREADIVSLAPAGAEWPTIDVCLVPEHKTVKNRLHLDLRADGSTAAEEIERLIAAGARRVDVGQPADASWTVLADPEGNEFCVLSRSVQDVT